MENWGTAWPNLFIGILHPQFFRVEPLGCLRLEFQLLPATAIKTDFLDTPSWT